MRTTDKAGFQSILARHCIGSACAGSIRRSKTNGSNSGAAPRAEACREAVSLHANAVPQEGRRPRDPRVETRAPPTRSGRRSPSSRHGREKAAGRWVGIGWRSWERSFPAADWLPVGGNAGESGAGGGDLKEPGGVFQGLPRVEEKATFRRKSDQKSFPAIPGQRDNKPAERLCFWSKLGGRSELPMKKTGKQSSVESSPSRSLPGTSKEALEQMCQTPSSKETKRIPLAAKPKVTSYSKELSNTWRDIRWYQVPLSSLRKPKAGLFSFTFQSSLQKYQQLRKTKQLKVGRPFSMLPLPNLSLTLTDCCQDLFPRNHRRHSRGGQSKGCRRLVHRRNEAQAFRQRMRKRLQKRQTPANLLPHKYVSSSAGIPGQQEEPGLRRSSRKTPKHKDPAAVAETLGSGVGSSLWGSLGSSLEEEEEEEMEMFPPDWTPPRIAFLYNEEPPLLSPVPEPASESRSSGEMPDITEETAGSPKVDLQANAASPAGGCCLPFLDEFGAWPVAIVEKVPVGDPECSTNNACVVAEPGLAEAVLKDKVTHLWASEEEKYPLLCPLATPSSTACFSGPLEELPGGRESLAHKTDIGGDPETARSSSLPPLHLLPPIPGISPRCSLSTTSADISGAARELTLGSDGEEDADDSSLLPLTDLFHGGDSSSHSVEMDLFPSPGPGSYLTSLSKLLEEKRERMRQEEELQSDLGAKLLFCNGNSLSAGDAGEEDGAPWPEAHRLVLERISMNCSTIPAVHPGEKIFLPSPYPRTALVLDTTGFTPRNQLERLFFSSSPSFQMTMLHSGCLSTLYPRMAGCPFPVLHWLFQLISLNPDVSADAFQVLWEISTRQIISSEKPAPDFWCPKLKDVTQAFYNLGAHVSALFPIGLIQLEFIPDVFKSSEHPPQSADVKNEIFSEESPYQFMLATMLGDTFKFLTLCVTSHPHHYPDHQLLALLAISCRVSLDKNLQKQPQMELQQLLLALLEAIQNWQEKLPELCRSLCHVSEHHHNLVAVVYAFPDTTARGQQLRRTLSLSFISQLLGKTQMVISPWQGEIQLQRLCHLLPLMKPASLKQALQKVPEQRGHGAQEAHNDLDQEACYLCYSLLTLANVVVGNRSVSPREQGLLWRLCVQLQRHISAGIREDPCLLYRTKLKDLAAKTYIKWQQLLPRGWLQRTPQQNPCGQK